jgi:hypothetical protein
MAGLFPAEPRPAIGPGTGIGTCFRTRTCRRALWMLDIALLHFLSETISSVPHHTLSHRRLTIHNSPFTVSAYASYERAVLFSPSVLGAQTSDTQNAVCRMQDAVCSQFHTQATQYGHIWIVKCLEMESAF